MEERKSNPTILYVDDDKDTRSVLKPFLRQKGYRVLADESEEDALQRVNDGEKFNADLILLGLGKKPEEMLAVGRRIRSRLKMDNVPVIVIASEYEAEMEGRDINVEENEWVTYLENGEQLQKLLGSLC